ncbi:MAG: hypothetical protein ACHRXM_20395 [Isosphaerales bacterium]
MSRRQSRLVKAGGPRKLPGRPSRLDDPLVAQRTAVLHAIIQLSKR